MWFSSMMALKSSQNNSVFIFMRKPKVGSYNFLLRIIVISKPPSGLLQA
jgi:hypothetical protein